MIPALNKSNLELRPDVVQAVSAGKFHIYAVESIDRGIEIGEVRLIHKSGGKSGEWQRSSEPESLVSEGS